MATRYINFGSFDGWAAKLDGYNTQLLDELNSISVEIDRLQETYQADSGKALKEEMDALKNKFDLYHQVVDSYVRFIRDAGNAYRIAENMNTSSVHNTVGTGSGAQSSGLYT